MKINTKQILKDLDDKDYLDSEGKIITVGFSIMKTLAVQMPSIDPWKQFKVIDQIQRSKDGEVDFTLEDLVFIKKTLEANASNPNGSFYIPHVIGQTINILESSKEKKEEPKVADKNK